MTTARPRTLEEALRALAQLDATVVAGGTDVMVEVNRGRRTLGDVVAVRRVPELRRLSISSREVRIGAALPYAEVTGSRGMSPVAAPALYTAARFMGSTQIRSTGTLGGNIATASPVGDALCALVALDAWVTVASDEGLREAAVSDVMIEGLAPHELLVDVHWPLATGPQRFLKVCRRGAVSRSVVSASVVADEDGKVRIVIGGCAPRPIRMLQAERAAQELGVDGTFSEDAAAIVGAAVSAELDPPSDIAGSSAYRRRAAGVLVRRALTTQRIDWAAA